jgi:hypothetical protein
VLILHTSGEEESDHAQQLMSNTGWLPDWANRYGRAAADYAPSPGRALAGFALIAGVGAALYWAFGRPQQNWNVTPRLGTRRSTSQSGYRSEGSRERPTAAEIYQNTTDRGEEAYSSGRTRVGVDSQTPSAIAAEHLKEEADQQRRHGLQETSPTMGNR